MEPEQFITQIRLMTHKFRPYLARLIYSMPLHPRPGIGTLAVDKQGRCYYDPAYLSTLTVEQGAYILVHEALHVLLRHAHQMQALLHGSTDPFRRFCCERRHRPGRRAAAAGGHGEAHAPRRREGRGPGAAPQPLGSRVLPADRGTVTPDQEEREWQWQR